MKAKVTQKYIRLMFDDIFSVGYCGAQSLLYGVEPFAYNSGVYGWNCDYYNLGGVIICTGYRPHGKSTSGKTAKYEVKARAIYEDWNLSYETKLEKIAEVRNEWLANLVNN